jgi:cbb3-type cytochrome oxidase subunit 3
MKKALKILIIMLMLTFVSGIVWFIYNPDKYSQTVVENIVDENFKVYPNH